jgi:thiol:disulfide interchange protein DsbD
MMAGAAFGQAIGMAPGAEAGAKVQASAVLDTTTVSGGEPFEVAITLATNPGWHIYWSNPGESGLATGFELTLPPGFKAEKVEYPVPHAFVMPGDVTIYGYEGKTTFLVKVTPPAGVSGSVSPIKVKASWLVCTKETCVPGDATMEVPMKVGSGEKVNEGLFAKAREAIPAEAATLGDLKEAPKSSATMSEGKVKYTVPLAFKEKVSKVEAFPDKVEGLEVSELKVAESEGETTISLTARLLSGQHVKVDTLPLVLAYTTADGKRRGLIVPLALDKLK